MKLRLAAALAAVLLMCVTGVAHATSITYIFTGTGDIRVGGTGGNNPSAGQSFVADTGGTVYNDFTVTLTGDTSGVVSAGEFFNQATTATFASGAFSTDLSPTVQAIANDAFIPSVAGSVSFGQSQPSPVFAVAEGVFGSAFLTYDLTTAFPLTSGTPSFSPQIFSSAAGDIEFDAIREMSFEADIPNAAVPEPSTVVLLGTVLVGLVAAGRLHKGLL